MSIYLCAAIAAWAAAQGSKYIMAVAREGVSSSWRQLYISGGMPSAHSAIMMSVTTVIGLADGFTSGLFGLATVISFVVMYDAMMVRRASGKQGEAIHELLQEVDSRVRPPKIARGHEPLEVCVGACVGTVVGLVVFFITR